MTNGIYLLLGSNLGDKWVNLLNARRQINELAGKVSLCSMIYHSAAWGKASQPSFLNQVISISSELTPKQLLSVLQSIEYEMGRVKIEKWGARIIDIDILYFSDLIIDQPELKIPHPEIAKRRFTLVPLVELIPEFIHPVLQKTNLGMLKVCNDYLNVRPMEHQEFEVK